MNYWASTLSADDANPGFGKDLDADVLRLAGTRVSALFLRSLELESQLIHVALGKPIARAQ